MLYTYVYKITMKMKPFIYLLLFSFFIIYKPENSVSIFPKHCEHFYYQQNVVANPKGTLQMRYRKEKKSQ